MLASEENQLGLMAVNRELIPQAEAQDESEPVVLKSPTSTPGNGNEKCVASNRQHRGNDFSRSTA